MANGLTDERQRLAGLHTKSYRFDCFLELWEKHLFARSINQGLGAFQLVQLVIIERQDALQQTFAFSNWPLEIIFETTHTNIIVQFLNTTANLGNFILPLLDLLEFLQQGLGDVLAV